MIAFLEGIVQSVSGDSAVVVCGSIGFRVFVGESTRKILRVGGKARLYTYHHVSDVQQSLYGFSSSELLVMFELLLKVSGIGPKGALNILTKAPLDVLQQAVVTQDAEFFHKMTGIGRRIADKVVAGLKNRVSEMPASDESSGVGFQDGEVVEALRGLGYSAEEARKALGSVPADAQSAEQRVAAALKILGQRSRVS